MEASKFKDLAIGDVFYVEDVEFQKTRRNVWRNRPANCIKVDGGMKLFCKDSSVVEVRDEN